ncbi:hypothetical protein G9A89_003559 [Geosiphon pyriformis]|nr:hypothetical protein G9A89_003559 [Geosiphon pyriformis]
MGPLLERGRLEANEKAKEVQKLSLFLGNLTAVDFGQQPICKGKSKGKNPSKRDLIATPEPYVYTTTNHEL